MGGGWTHKSLVRQKLVSDDVVLELAALVAGPAAVDLSLEINLYLFWWLRSWWLLCRTWLALSSTKWVRSTFSSLCPLSSNQRCQTTSGTSKNFFQECQESNPVLLGEKQECHFGPLLPPCWGFCLTRLLVQSLITRSKWEKDQLIILGLFKPNLTRLYRATFSMPFLFVDVLC